MSMKIAIIKGKGLHGWSILSKVFTGCRAFHVGFLSEKTGYFYDISLLQSRRKILWTESKYAAMDVELFNCRVNEGYLASKLVDDSSYYGILAYLMFGFRKFGFKVTSSKGIVCSEMVNNDIRHFRTETPWPPEAAPPSPCDLLRHYRTLAGK